MMAVAEVATFSRLAATLFDMAIQEVQEAAAGRRSLRSIVVIADKVVFGAAASGGADA